MKVRVEARSFQEPSLDQEHDVTPSLSRLRSKGKAAYGSQRSSRLQRSSHLPVIARRCSGAAKITMKRLESVAHDIAHDVEARCSAESSAPLTLEKQPFKSKVGVFARAPYRKEVKSRHFRAKKALVGFFARENAGASQRLVSSWRDALAGECIEKGAFDLGINALTSGSAFFRASGLQSAERQSIVRNDSKAALGPLCPGAESRQSHPRGKTVRRLT